MSPYSTLPTTDLSLLEVPFIKSENSVSLESDTETGIHTQGVGYKTFFGIFEAELKWDNIIGITVLHSIFVWGLLTFDYLNNLRLFFYCEFLIRFTGIGVTAGAHRLWCHRSYNAKLPLRIFLMLLFSAAAQNSLFHWVRDHRVHHKFSETDADPHNSKKGFFFAHVGWLMMKKHPEVIRRGKEIDMSDILSDPVVQFHEKYFIWLKLFLGFFLPALIPPLVWGQDWYWTCMGAIVARYSLSLNFTWFVNSAAHIWGTKPYDKRIGPAENLTVSYISQGEGFHNYHHTFPWDYKAAELGNYKLNITTLIIDAFAKIGWAYDLKQPSKELVRNVIEKTGDGSHPTFGHVEIPESAEFEMTTQGNDNILKRD